MSKISELSDGGAIQSGDTLIAVRSGGNVKVTYGGTTTANIDGGTIDGTVIGGSSAAAGSFTTLTTSSNVGIGTATPDSYRLNLYGAGNGGRQLKVEGTSNNGLMRFSNSEAKDYSIGINGTSFIVYDDTADTYRMVVDTNGNVGIGTTSPSTHLDVTGGTTNQVAIFRSSDATATIGFADDTTPLTGNLSYVTVGAVGNNMVFNTNLAEAMRIDSSGNVGIGTSSPSNNLAIYESSTGNAGIDIDNTQSGTALTIGKQGSTAYGATSAGDGAMYVYDASLSLMADGGAGNTSAIKFSTGGNTERMRIDSSGNVGIGTSSPVAIGGYSSLTMNNTTGTFVEFQEAGTNRLRIGVDNGSAFINGSSGILRLLTSDIERMRIDSSGNMNLFGVGSQLDFETTGGGQSNSIKTVDNYNMQLYCGRGSTSAITIGSSDLTFDTGGSERARIDSSGNVGIGTSSPAATLHVKTVSGNGITLEGSTDSDANGIYFNDTSGLAARIEYDHSSNFMRMFTNASEAMRIDSSGNLLVGLTSTAGYTAGRINTTTATGHWGLTVKDTVANASMVQFLKADGTQTGALKNRSEFLQIGKGDIGLEFHDSDNAIYPAHITNNTLTDNTANLGSAFFRFAALYAANGTIQTSDQNLKQDIRDITEAEQRVAIACKGLMKAYRFKDAVEAKGDDARIHFGIMAQDLQAAFEAEGLDASRYGVFCSDTRTDEETGEVHTRLGVRYEELLAFIIAAI